MAKGYWVAQADVSDPEAYKAYVAANRAVFREYGARFLVRGGVGEAPEGQPRSRIVVLEFPSYEAAVACYRSEGYQKAVALRLTAAVADLAIIPGYEGPQPLDD